MEVVEDHTSYWVHKDLSVTTKNSQALLTVARVSTPRSLRNMPERQDALVPPSIHPLARVRRMKTQSTTTRAGRRGGEKARNEGQKIASIIAHKRNNVIVLFGTLKMMIIAFITIKSS